MKHWIGFDVGKRFHWLCVLDEEGQVLLSRRVDATEERLEAACSEIAALGNAEERMVAIDLVGGPATLLETILLERGEQVRYIPGTAVNKVRDAYSGGEHKSDPKDAFVIADQLRLRWRSLREVRIREENTLELKTLVSYRKDLLQDQRRRVSRLRELLSQVFPGLEAALPDLAEKGALLTVAKVARPSDARKLGKSRLARWLKSRGSRKSEALAERALVAAKAQQRELPAARVKAALVSEIAWEIIRTKERIAELERRLEELVETEPKGEIVRSMPGMGLILTAEFLAEVDEIGRYGSPDRFAAAAGIAPVLRASGSLSYQRRAKKGNRALKRVFYQSAYCAISHHKKSRDYYRRKRAEGKAHHQAVIALARRRANVLWAMLRDGATYQEVPLAA
jgi:transposase